VDDPRFDTFCELIRRHATKLNLVSPADLAVLEERHIADSLRAAPLLDQAPPGVCADVGSGAGFPGIPLAIARPERRWRLIEPRRRRAGFLEEVVRTLGLDSVEVVGQSAEDAARDLGATHALVTARAVASPDQTIALMAPLAIPGGLLVLFHGRRATLPPGAEEWQEGLAIVRA
jgi:16S rRNA (guanine527-N7)-methyltransferase